MGDLSLSLSLYGSSAAILDVASHPRCRQPDLTNPTLPMGKLTTPTHAVFSILLGAVPSNYGISLASIWLADLARCLFRSDAAYLCACVRIGRFHHSRQQCWPPPQRSGHHTRCRTECELIVIGALGCPASLWVENELAYKIVLQGDDQRRDRLNND